MNEKKKHGEAFYAFWTIVVIIVIVAAGRGYYMLVTASQDNSSTVWINLNNRAAIVLGHVEKPIVGQGQANWTSQPIAIGIPIEINTERSDVACW